MKRVIPIVLALLFVVTSAGCININVPAKPTEEPTEAPFTEEPTEAPTEEPAVTEAPTEEPVVTEPPELTGFADYCTPLDINKSIGLDLDFDGIEDTVFIKKYDGDYDDNYDVNITLGKSPSKTHTYTVEDSYDLSAWVVDCDPSDKRLEVLFTFAQDSDDWTSVALRVNKNGSGIDEFHDYVQISGTIKKEFTSEKGFPILKMTDILGTHSIGGYNTVTQYMFEKTSDEYFYYGYPEIYVELEKKFEVTILNDDGSLGETVTLKKGAKLYPCATDNSTYVIVELEDGRKARIEVEYHSYPYYEDWGIFLNGINQDDLFDILYAD